MIEILSEFRLITAGEGRTFARSEADVMASLGITEDDIENAEDVEIE